MVLMIKGVKVTRIFNGKKYTLEAAEKNKSDILKRKAQLKSHGYNVRVVKSKSKGYLLYST